MVEILAFEAYASFFFVFTEAPYLFMVFFHSLIISFSDDLLIITVSAVPLTPLISSADSVTDTFFCACKLFKLKSTRLIANNDLIKFFILVVFMVNILVCYNRCNAS